MRCLVIALAVASTAASADLDAIVATQRKLIAARDPNKLPRDEVPLEEVALAKRQLLSWAESRLRSFGGNVEPGDLTSTLTNELNRAIEPPTSDDMDLLGDLTVSFSRPEGESTWLQMNTDVGLQCGADRSVYLYEWRRERWNRRFALEATDYRRDRHGPEGSVKLQISPPDPSGARLVLATGTPPFCMSVWHTLYIRLFRIDNAQALLVEQTPTANLGQDDSPYSRLEPHGALIEFWGWSIDSDILIRKHVRRYKVDHDRAERIEPIAFSARDFVDEWLTRPWAEIAPWSDPQLAERHKSLHKDSVSGVFGALKRCAKPGEWQVPVDLGARTVYFSVLERARYRFTMLRISEEPRPDCSEPDETPNAEWPPTLFPKNR